MCCASFTVMDRRLQQCVQCVQCPVCQEGMVAPMVLPLCGHSFCYTCVKSWCESNPNCPLCRRGLDQNPPVLNHTLYSVTKILLNGEGGARQAEYERDERNGFPWLAKVCRQFGRAVVDDDDHVPRCSACHWELVDGQCENCGRTMVGWEPRADADEGLDSDDGWEQERHQHRRQRQRSSGWGRGVLRATGDASGSEGDYDNGLNDELMLHEADEDNFSDGDDVDWADDEQLPLQQRRRPRNVYESRGESGETVLLDSDGERPIPGQPTRLVRLDDSSSHWENHEQSVALRPWRDQYESDDGFVVDDDEVEDGDPMDDVDETVQSGQSEDEFASGDEDLLHATSLARLGRDKNVVSLDSDEESSDEDGAPRGSTRVPHATSGGHPHVVDVDDVFSDDDEEMISTLKSSVSRKPAVPDSDEDSDDGIVIVKRKPNHGSHQLSD